MSEALLDGTRPVRKGEELPLERLAPYLQEALGALGAEVSVTQFPGGHSNLTYAVRVGEREYVLRRPPFGSKVKSAHDMGREFRILSALAPSYPKAPRPALYCEDESIMGAKFYLMERVRGLILRKQPPEGVLTAPEAQRALCEAFVDALAELHALDYRALGLESFGNPEGYVLRQVSGWTKRYQDAKTDDIPTVDRLAAWLHENLPATRPGTILHNDYKLDNLVLDPGATTIRALLDWEMAALGDPLMDLGTALCYWVEANDSELMQMIRFGPTHLPGCLTRAQLIERYAQQSGRDVSEALFYYCFGLFKTAVVAQQIYYRFAKGFTQDPRFAIMIEGVKILTAQGVLQLERRTL